MVDGRLRLLDARDVVGADDEQVVEPVGGGEPAWKADADGPIHDPCIHVPGGAAGGSVVFLAGRGLLHAFALAGADCPDWSLRIYGDGAERARIAERITHHGLGDRAFMMGTATPIENEWVKGSIAAVTSAHESFGMTIVEAMRCGLPVVSTDCPHGPAEIIRHGTDGLLVPRDSTRRMADALRTLMLDAGRRKEMGRAARTGAAASLSRRSHSEAAPVWPSTARSAP